MCGIIAYYSKQTQAKHFDILQNLMKQSIVRGVHSFGYAYYKDNQIETRKFFQFPKSINGFIESKSKCFIWHNRYSTSGDWQEMKNNQPITIQDISIAMNGVISMKAKEDYEKKFAIKCETENDSEVFIHLLKRYSPENVLRIMGGSCAVVFLQDNMVFAIRNEFRPLYYFKLYNGNFICSTNDIAFRATGIYAQEIRPYELLKLSTL